MERVATFAKHYNQLVHRTVVGTRRLTERAVIARKFAGWTGAIELNATDTADFIFGHIPVPGRDGVPFFQRNLHVGVQLKREEKVEGER
jgi:hypothetical protein